MAFSAKEALIKSPLRKSDPVSTIEIHLPLKSKSFLRHPSNLKFGQDFQLRLNQRFPKFILTAVFAAPSASVAFMLVAFLASLRSDWGSRSHEPSAHSTAPSDTANRA